MLWHLLVTGGILSTLLVATGALCGTFVLEKLLTALAMPCGIVWLGMGASLYVTAARGCRRVSFLIGIVLFGYTVAGNGWFATWLLESLESNFYVLDSIDDAPTVDVLIVLGGGVEKLASGEVQLNAQGDRLVRAARLFHCGKTDQLAATGIGLTADGFADPVGGAKAAARIWQDLKIPSTAITLVPGRNTAEEMRHIREMFSDRQDVRLGLLTSAWHLPRALRLARQNRVEVIPFAADFRTGKPRSPRWLPTALVPNPDAFCMTSIAMKEYLAYLVKR